LEKSAAKAWRKGMVHNKVALPPAAVADLTRVAHILRRTDNHIVLHPFVWSPWTWVWDLPCTNISTDASGTVGWGAEWEGATISGTWSEAEKTLPIY
jgi:hypothetical protein